MAEGRPEPPPRPRIRGTGWAVRQGEGVAAWPGSWPWPAAWIRTGNFDRGKRGTGAEARPSRAHRPRAAPRCAGRTGAPGRNGRSRPRPPAGSGQPWAAGRFADLGADLGPVPRWWPCCPAGRIMDKGRPEPSPRPRIRAQGGPSGKVKGWRRWPGSWPWPAAWIRTGNFDRGKRGTGAEARPSRAHRPQAAPRCAGRTGAPGRSGRSRPRPPAGSGQPWAAGRFAGLGADLGPVPR